MLNIDCALDGCLGLDEFMIQVVPADEKAAFYKFVVPNKQ